MTHLRVDGTRSFATDGASQSTERTGVAPRHDDGVDPKYFNVSLIGPLFFFFFFFEYCPICSPVQMSCEIPEARLASESSIDENVESADAEKSRIALSTGEDVKGWMIETDVANNIRWLQ